MSVWPATAVGGRTAHLQLFLPLESRKQPPPDAAVIILGSEHKGHACFEHSRQFIDRIPTPECSIACLVFPQGLMAPFPVTGPDGRHVRGSLTNTPRALVIGDAK